MPPITVDQLLAYPPQGQWPRVSTVGGGSLWELGGLRVTVGGGVGVGGWGARARCFGIECLVEGLFGNIDWKVRGTLLRSIRFRGNDQRTFEDDSMKAFVSYVASATVLALFSAPLSSAAECPFCSAVKQTFGRSSRRWMLWPSAF